MIDAAHTDWACLTAQSGAPAAAPPAAAAVVQHEAQDCQAPEHQAIQLAAEVLQLLRVLLLRVLLLVQLLFHMVLQRMLVLQLGLLLLQLRVPHVAHKPPYFIFNCSENTFWTFYWCGCSRLRLALLPALFILASHYMLLSAPFSSHVSSLLCFFFGVFENTCSCWFRSTCSAAGLWRRHQEPLLHLLARLCRLLACKIKGLPSETRPRKQFCERDADRPTG
ncbi:hypothetical protein ABPG77_003045 [Micractinium sp. CCAP 211/92]